MKTLTRQLPGSQKELYRRLQRTVPPLVQGVLKTLAGHGFAAHLVGGCVRDMLLGRQPEDWDVATEVLPNQIMDVFPRTVPTGLRHGTVTVLTGEEAVEVTTYRVESAYSDGRHPDRVEFTRRLEDDLGRRDITINAMAVALDGQLIDPYGGLDDLRAGIVRAVGDPGERFREDALRMIRVIRLAAQLGFNIHEGTYHAIGAEPGLLDRVSAERIRDEFVKAILSPSPRFALELLKDTGLLDRFLPELLEGVGFEQNVHHDYTVWEHNLLATENTPPVLHLRLAALFHDIAKPRCLSVDGDGKRRFFHHEHVGAQMTATVMKRLKFDRRTIGRVVHLVRHHLALHHYPDMSDAAVRRLIRRVGLDEINDLIHLRQADRIASGTKKGPVSRGTRRLLERIEVVLAEDAAFGLKDLAVGGHEVMQIAGIAPGPQVGRILNQLLEEVLDDPELNTKEALAERIRELTAADG